MQTSTGYTCHDSRQITTATCRSTDTAPDVDATDRLNM